MIYRCLPYDYLNLNMCWGYLIYELCYDLSLRNKIKAYSYTE